ncbi:MAG: endolytic transglycosylase MltG [Bdellovibrionota bacterium]
MFRRFLSALGRVGGYLIAFIIGIVFVQYLYKTNFAAVQPGSTEHVYFEVGKGSNLRTISEELEKRGLIKHWYSLYWLSKFKADADGLKILAGEYDLSPGLSPFKIFEILLSGKIVQHPITIPEGVNVRDIAQVMAKSGLVSLEDAKRSLSDRNLMVSLEIPALTPEGYLYPETYNFSRPITSDQIVIRIVQEGMKKMDEGIRSWKERAAELGFSPYQMLTLASIIEKETAKAEERGLIASVFHNRLRIGMPLQSDPTVIYGLPDFNGNLTKEDLKTPSPYNTYLNTGLPPTPICNPSLASLKAALYPDETDYLYFVGKGDGGHHFSATYKEHQLAVKNFQQGGQAPAAAPAPASAPAAAAH